jgi:hypothetical protein
MNNLRDLLNHRYFPLIIAAVAMLLTIPSLKVGWVADDHHHRIALSPDPADEAYREQYISKNLHSLDLFRFCDGDPAHTQPLMNHLLPWWTHPEIKTAFWRPVTCLTHILDYKLWPSRPSLMHLQSVVWYGLCVIIIAVYFRKMMGLTWAAGLAGLIWAFDYGHGTPVGFLANRNALVAAFFAVACLIAHDAWRRQGRRWGAVFAPLLLAIGLLSKEEGLAVFGLLVAYAICIDISTITRRIATLLPYIMVIVLWRLAWSGLGYGFAYAGDMYIDPMADPVGFIRAAFIRLPILLGDQWFLPLGGILVLFLGSAFTAKLAVSAAIALAVIGLLLAPMVRKNRTACFWLLGMALSAIPLCSTIPSDRLLLIPGVGAAALMGQFLEYVFGHVPQHVRKSYWRIPAKILCVFLITYHLCLSPAALALRARYPMGPPSWWEQWTADIPPDPALFEQTLIFVNPPSTLHAAYTPVVLESRRQPYPRFMYILSPGWFPVHVYRPDANSLVVRPDGGYLLAMLDQLFRGNTVALKLGEKIERIQMTVEITELTPDGRPAEARFIFKSPLEDKTFRWLQFVDGKGFTDFIPPNVGESVTIDSGMSRKLRF